MSEQPSDPASGGRFLDPNLMLTQTGREEAERMNLTIETARVQLTRLGIILRAFPILARPWQLQLASTALTWTVAALASHGRTNTCKSMFFAIVDELYAASSEAERLMTKEEREDLFDSAQSLFNRVRSIADEAANESICSLITRAKKTPGTFVHVLLNASQTLTRFRVIYWNAASREHLHYLIPKCTGACVAMDALHAGTSGVEEATVEVESLQAYINATMDTIDHWVADGRCTIEDGQIVHPNYRHEDADNLANPRITSGEMRLARLAHVLKEFDVFPRWCQLNLTEAAIMWTVSTLALHERRRECESFFYNHVDEAYAHCADAQSSITQSKRDDLDISANAVRKLLIPQVNQILKESQEHVSRFDANPQSNPGECVARLTAEMLARVRVHSLDHIPSPALPGLISKCCDCCSSIEAWQASRGDADLFIKMLEAAKSLGPAVGEIENSINNLVARGILKVVQGKIVETDPAYAATLAGRDQWMY